MTTDYIEIGPQGSPYVTFGVDTSTRPNPHTNPQRGYAYDGAGKVTGIVETINLECWFKYEPEEIWQKFREIQAALERGIMDFRYYRPGATTNPVLELRAADHVASPRYEILNSEKKDGELANHVKFALRIVAERGKDWGSEVVEVDRNIERQSTPDEEGGNTETRTIRVRGYEEPSKAIIESFLSDGKLKDLESIVYRDRPDQLVWEATARFKRKSTTGIESFHESISVSGGGQPLNFFGRSGSRLPLKFVGKHVPFVIVITGEMRAVDILSLRLPSRRSVGLLFSGQNGVSGKASGQTGAQRISEELKRLGKDGATQFEIAVIESNPDGTPKKYVLRYTETYKRALYEDEILSVVQKDYFLNSVDDIKRGASVAEKGVGKHTSFFSGTNFGNLRWGWIQPGS